MSTGLLLFVGAIYIWVAYGYLKAGRVGMAIAFLCYALSNMGFAWDARGQ